MRFHVHLQGFTDADGIDGCLRKLGAYLQQLGSDVEPDNIFEPHSVNTIHTSEECATRGCTTSN